MAALLAMAPQYQLAWKPVVGETHSYSVSVRFDYDPGALDIESDLTLKVLSVDPKGNYRLRVTSKNATAKIGGETKPLDEQQPSDQSFAADGTPLDRSVREENKDGFSDLLNHLTVFQAPPHAIRVGDSWQNRPSGPKTGFLGTPWITYRFAEIVKSAKSSYAKVRYEARHGLDPQAANGTLLLSRPNNALYRLVVSILHFKPEGTAVEATVDVVVQEK
ncbi:MAG TPA: hypothetical protein VG944_15540 [Fimbriimonas sp.]|nr:hypothetical protein [Fimbriimonas sp.]